MLKKDNMVSCGAPGDTNRADKNYNIIALVTMIMMLLQLYRSIFRTFAYLMPEAYSKNCQISKIMRYIENPVIVKTVYSGICRHNQGHSTIFSHVHAYSGIIEAYLVIFRQIQNSV